MPTAAKQTKLSLSSRLNLLLYRRVFDRLAKKRPPRPAPIRLAPQSRVLVFSSAGLGDSLLDSVAIRALAETFPGIHIAAVVHHRRPHISQHNPFLAQLYFLKKGPPAFLALARQLRRDGPWDAVLYLSCHDPEARCLGYLLNRDATVGLSWRTGFGNLCAVNLDEPGLQRAHLARQALRVAEAAGARLVAARMVYEVAPEDRQALDRRLAELNLPAKPAVVFQLGGGGAAYREWPVEYFAELGFALQAAGIGPIFILGGPDHLGKAAAFAGLAKERGLDFSDVVGKLPIAQSAALLERSAALVSTDTGIMHLGFALGTPTAALLHCSPGDARVGPLADRDRHVVMQIPRPQGYRTPADAPMSGLLPAHVIPRVLELLQRKR